MISETRLSFQAVFSLVKVGEGKFAGGSVDMGHHSLPGDFGNSPPVVV